MKNFLAKIRIDYIISSLLCILLGVAFIAWHNSIIDLIGFAIAIAVMILGGVIVCGFVLSETKKWYTIALGVVILVIGIVALFQRAFFATLVPILVGLILIALAIRTLAESLSNHKRGFRLWYVGVILSAITLVLGVLCIINAFEIVQIGMIIIGVFLIFTGILNVWTCVTTNISCRGDH